MIKENNNLEALKIKRIEKRKKVAEATGKILVDLEGVYVELDCQDQALDEVRATVANIIEKIIACDDRVTQRAMG